MLGEFIAQALMTALISLAILTAGAALVEMIVETVLAVWSRIADVRTRAKLARGVGR